MGHSVHQFGARRNRRPALKRFSLPTTSLISIPSVTIMSDARPQLGQLGEQLACEHFLRRGFQILERNYRTRWGELDIIAFDGHTLVFCEVKARRLAPGEGSPFEAIGTYKQTRVRRMAASWLIERTERPYANCIRFDAVGVRLDRRGGLVSLEHLESAF